MISSLLPLPMGEVPLEGAERACLPSQSLCDSSPKVGAKEKRIVTGGNPWKGPHQCEHWFAMTFVVRFCSAQCADTEQCPIVLQLHTGPCTHRPRQLAAKRNDP